MLKKNAIHGQIQIPFAWLFAIIVGAFILFLAIYASTKIINVGEQKAAAETGKEFDALLNPLETGFESGSSILIEMPLESRINNSCNDSGNFGEQTITLAQQTSRGWVETDINFTSKNRYIFSEKSVEGQDFFVFIKPFNLPFKVGDLIYLTSKDKNYCFVNPPSEIENEISNLNQQNLVLRQCPVNSTTICFGVASGIGYGCDVVIDKNSKTVTRKGQSTVYYETNALMYAAIFSDSKTYECEVKRLMQRGTELSSIYNEKENNLASKEGCDTNVNTLSLMGSLKSYTNSGNLVSVQQLAQQIDGQNDLAKCKLW